MLGSALQSMGTASKLIRLMILILVGIIIWRLWYHVFPSSPSMPPELEVNLIKTDNKHLKTMHHQTEKLEVVVTSGLRITVYYEALCPDSRDFIVRQLLPVYEKLSDVMAVDLIPYGKATSHVVEDGRIKFSCQHGPSECNANMVHACVTKHVTDENRRLHIVKCMIDSNSLSSDPYEVGRKCVSQFKDEEWKAIEKCSHGNEGEQLLYHLGKLTHDLVPKITFIPTIAINDSLKNQPLILRNFLKVVCDAYSGPKQSICGSAIRATFGYGSCNAPDGESWDLQVIYDYEGARNFGMGEQSHRLWKSKSPVIARTEDKLFQCARCGAKLYKLRID